MGRTSRTHEEMKNVYKICYGNFSGRNYLIYSVDGKIILK
jgi:hypothetical protein